MSSAGKDVLIKVVAQAIPTYAMSCLDLTKSLCDDIGRMVCRFWWAQQENENKMHWISCERLCSRKKKGGMGYRDLHLFNLAMLARQGWRLIVELDSLCAQVLRAKYYPNGDLLGVKEKSGISYSWRSLIRGLKALNNGLIWRVGDGTNINIWTDPWILMLLASCMYLVVAMAVLMSWLVLASKGTRINLQYGLIPSLIL